MKLSLVIPCYNEEDNIPALYSLIRESFSGVDFDYELVFVNDGSSDGTQQRLKELFDLAESNVKVIRFSRNFGKEAAIYAGIKNAVGEYVSTIDADLQQNPKLVLKMMSFLEENEDYDCVAAFQENRREGKLISFLKSGFYKLINRITDIDFVNGASDFRTFRRSVAIAISEMTEYHRFLKGIFSWVGFNTHFMPYVADKRAAGSTKFSFWRLFKLAMEGIIAFTTAPLRIATFTGIITAMISVIYLIIVVIQKLFFSIDVPGYATIVVLILLLGGMQLFCLGIIGEYLAKTYIQAKDRPIYIAKDILNYEDKRKDGQNLD